MKKIIFIIIPIFCFATYNTGKINEYASNLINKNVYNQIQSLLLEKNKLIKELELEQNKVNIVTEEIAKLNRKLDHEKKFKTNAIKIGFLTPIILGIGILGIYDISYRVHKLYKHWRYL